MCGHDFNIEFLFMFCDVIIVAVYEIKKEYHIYKRLILFLKIVVEVTISRIYQTIEVLINYIVLLGYMLENI